MSNAERVLALLERWDDLADQGQRLSLDDLCHDCPELRPEVSRAMHVLHAWSNLQATRTDAGDRAESSPTLPRVAGYEVLGVLGGGGMGVVYRARQVALNRVVALKMIRGTQPRPADVGRLRIEAESIARLRHPNIVQIYEVGESHGAPYLALELVEGGSLDRRLRGTPVAPTTSARLLLPLARAMHAAHASGIVHRDLEPANVLLDGPPQGPLEECRPRVTDFGLAKLLDDDSGMTRSGDVLGTPSYMAPEQAAGRPRDIGPATDVYALGAVLYEMLAGRPPFVGVSLMDTLEQVRHQEPVAPRRLVPGVPRDLETLCLKCLDKAPARRYPTALALAEDLERYLDGRPITARPVGPAGRGWRWCKRSPVVASLLAALFLVTAAGFGLVTWKWRAEAGARAEAERQRDRTLLVARSYRLFQQKLGGVAVRDSFWSPYLIAANRTNMLKMTASGQLLQEFAGDTPEDVAQRAKDYVGLVRKLGEVAPPADSLPLFAEAGPAIDGLAAKNPEEPLYLSLRADLHAGKAKALERAGKADEAAAERRLAAERYGEAIPGLGGEAGAEALAARAEVWADMGSPTEARDDLKRALGLAPRTAWHMKLAETLIGLKAHEEAVAQVELAASRSDRKVRIEAECSMIYAMAVPLAGSAGLSDRYASRSVAFFWEAWRAGLKGQPRQVLNLLRTNPDYKRLHGRSDFRQLLAEVEGAAGK